MNRLAYHFFKEIVLNVIFLILFFLVSDISIQTFKYFKSRYDKNPDKRYLFFNKINDLPRNMTKWTELDSILGYRLTSNFSKTMNYTNWIKGSKLTIDQDNFRSNDNSFTKKDIRVLLLGDSYAFCSQVSNNETISSYLETKSFMEVKNAGVPGYGIAQSVKKGEILIEKRKKNFDIAILSILMNSNLERSKYKYRGGYPKLSLLKENDVIKYATPPENLKETIFETKKDLNLFDETYRFLINYSIIVNKMLDRRLLKAPFFKTVLNHSPPTKTEILDFVLDNFKNLKTNYHILLLLYDDYLISNPNVYYFERNLITEKAQKENLILIDTFEMLRSQEEHKTLWLPNHGHHTPKGNELISELINEYLSQLIFD